VVRAAEFGARGARTGSPAALRVRDEQPSGVCLAAVVRRDGRPARLAGEGPALAGAGHCVGNGGGGAAIRLEAGPWVVLGCIQVHAFCSAPTWSIASTIVFARLADAKKEFGPIRAMATIGWMTGCVLVSVLSADRSTLAGYGGAVVWLTVSAFTFWLPSLETPPAAAGLTWAQRFGLDALQLLRDRDHRVVFLTTSLFMIPLAGFYPTPRPICARWGSSTPRRG